MPIETKRVLLRRDQIEAQGLACADHVDAYVCRFNPERHLDARRFAVSFVGYRPLWFRALLRLRNFLVKPLGLRSGGSSRSPIPSSITQGGKLAFFSVLEAEQNRVALYAEDSHLDSRLTIDSVPGRLTLTTAIRYRNRLGRLYMAVAMPFRLFVVRRFAVHAVQQFLDEDD